MKRSFFKMEYLAALGLLVFCLLLLAVGTVQARYANEQSWLAQLLPINADSEALREGSRHFVLKDWQTSGTELTSRTLTVPVSTGDYGMTGEILCYTQAQGDLAIMNSSLSGFGLETVDDKQLLTLAAGEQTELTLTLQLAYPSVEEETWVKIYIHWLPEVGGLQKLLQADYTVWLLPPEPVELPEPTEPEEPTEPTEATEPTEPEEPSEPTEPTEPEEPTEPTEPTEPSEPAPEAGQSNDAPKRGKKSSTQLVSNVMQNFAPDGPVAMQLTPPEGTRSILLENRASETGEFPAGTAYSLDLGKSWYCLYEPGTLQLRQGEEDFWLLLDFSEAPTALNEKVLWMLVSALDGENPLMMQDVTATSGGALPRVKSEGMQLLDGSSRLEIVLSEGWDAGLWSVEVERLELTEDKELVFVPIDLQQNGFVLEQSGTLLSLRADADVTPAGTYRMLMKQEFHKAVITAVEAPFFVVYLPETTAD